MASQEPENGRTLGRMETVAQKLTFTIENKRPIELTDLVASYQGMALEYRDFVLTNGGIIAPGDVKLYVHELRAGSAIAELAPLVPVGLAYVEHVNQVCGSVSEFAMHLRAGIFFLLGKGEKPAKEMDRQNLVNYHNIVEPVAKDQGSQMIVNGGVTVNGPATFNLGSMEASALQNEIRRQMEVLKEPVTGKHFQVLLYLRQARNDVKDHAGDRGIIEKFSPKPLRLLWEHDETKAEILATEANPFHFAYVVDVEVGTIDGAPATYKILALHEKIERA